MKPHKHAALIKAWADGAKIQVWVPQENTWRSVVNPVWIGDTYRIKPNIIKYRLYLNTRGEVRTIRSEEEPLVWFVKWIGDWQEVEV